MVSLVEKKEENPKTIFFQSPWPALDPARRTLPDFKILLFFLLDVACNKNKRSATTRPVLHSLVNTQWRWQPPLARNVTLYTNKKISVSLWQTSVSNWEAIRIFCFCNVSCCWWCDAAIISVALCQWTAKTSQQTTTTTMTTTMITAKCSLCLCSICFLVMTMMMVLVMVATAGEMKLVGLLYIFKNCCRLHYFCHDKI